MGTSVQEVKLPLSFRTLAIAHPGAPVKALEKTIGSLNDDEVLVRVSYASINKMDPFMALMNLFNLPEPYTLGFDFSGEVVKVGGKDAGRDEPRVGDQVFGNTHNGGGYAEYLVAKKEHVFSRGAVPAPEACTYGVAYLTAYESLVIMANLQPYKGKWIYVAGAAGGVGHFGAQIAKLYGLKVVGSAGKAASLNLLRELKLDHVIDYSKQDVVQEIMNLTGGKGADLVYDSTYTQPSYTQSTAVVASGGEYIRLGTPEQVARVGAQDMTAVVEGRGAKMTITDVGRYSVDPKFMAQISKLRDGMRQAVTWYEEGKVKPVVTATVPFDAAALQQAFGAFISGTINVGKVIVQCSR
jgi:NADPH:quinone reductase